MSSLESLSAPALSSPELTELEKLHPIRPLSGSQVDAIAYIHTPAGRAVNEERCGTCESGKAAPCVYSRWR